MDEHSFSKFAKNLCAMFDSDGEFDKQLLKAAILENFLRPDIPMAGSLFQKIPTEEMKHAALRSYMPL